MAFIPTDDFITDTYYTDTITSNKHFLGDVSIEALHLSDETSLRIGSDFCITASELKHILNYLKSIHPEAFI